MRLKNVYISFLLCSAIPAQPVYAQDSAALQSLDTITIIDYSIKKEPKASDFNISPLQKQFNGLQDIGELLQTSSPVQINSYGLGNTSSISIRGGNDDHTNVYWNGLRLNSLTLGGTDISLIPIESGDAIEIHTNATSIGGILDINSKPDWNNRFSLHLRSDYGNLNSYRNSLGFTAGNRKVQFRSNAFYLHAENNFAYTDPYKFGKPRDTIEHNSIRSVGTVNTLFIQLKRQQSLHVGSWFQKKDKEVPSIMGTYEISSKFQKDMSVRHFLTWNKYAEKIRFKVLLAHTFDALKYTDKKQPSDTFLFINSSYNTHRVSNTFSVQNFFRYGIVLTSGYEYDLLIADVKEYAKNVTDHVGNVFTSVDYRQGNIRGSLKLTQPFSSFRYIRPQVYVDAGYTITNHKYSILFSYSDKYRFPNLNDRYWNPGGNPALQPETGWTVDLGQAVNLFTGNESAHELKAQVNAYFSKIRNNIVWTPVTNIIWSPKNLKSTRLYGTEAQLSYGYRAKHGLLVFINCIYNFNRSQILSDALHADLTGNFLRYKPQHTFKTNLYFEDRFFGIGCNYQYVSARFTDEENFDFFALKPYHLTDLYLTFKGSWKQHALQFIFKVNNLTNTSYESIRSYAQPGRYYTLSLNYHFKQLNRSI